LLKNCLLQGKRSKSGAGLSQNLENVLHGSVEESFKRLADPDPAADDFRSLKETSLPKDTSLVKFS